MKGVLRWFAVFAASFLVAKLVESLLTSKQGRRLAESTGSDVFLSEAGRNVVNKYSKEATGVILDALLSRQERRALANGSASHWPNLFEDAATTMSATGSLLRIVADLWRERQELGRSQPRAG